MILDMDLKAKFSNEKTFLFQSKTFGQVQTNFGSIEGQGNNMMLILSKNIVPNCCLQSFFSAKKCSGTLIWQNCLGI